MNRREIISAIALLPFTSGCLYRNLPSYRYRMTVEVDTPEGVRRGSTVIEVQTKVQFQLTRGIKRFVKGEAAVVDLGKYGLLFALLNGDTYADWAGNVYTYVTPLVPEGPTLEDTGRRGVWAHSHTKELIQLPRYFSTKAPDIVISGYPSLVRFRNRHDYRTFERVDPDDLAASFGEGVSLKRITVQITQDEPQKVINHYLPWLKQNSTDPGLGQPATDFSQWKRKNGYQPPYGNGFNNCIFRL